MHNVVSFDQLKSGDLIKRVMFFKTYVYVYVYQTNDHVWLLEQTSNPKYHNVMSVFEKDCFNPCVDFQYV